MTSPAGRPPVPLTQESAALTNAVAAASRAIRRGETADLTPLAERLRALMAAFAGGTAEQRRGELARLLGLADEIETLSGLIGEESRRCCEQLARGGASARATAAYATRARG